MVNEMDFGMRRIMLMMLPWRLMISRSAPDFDFDAEHFLNFELADYSLSENSGSGFCKIQHCALNSNVTRATV